MSNKPRLPAIVSIFVLLVSTAGCGMLGGPRSQAAKSEPVARQVDVFYVTDRAPADRSGRSFGSERGTVSFGVTNVSIPPGHLMGHIEEPSLLSFEWSPDEHKHIKVRDVIALPRDEFADRLTRAVEGSRGHKLMIFVHGYNETFASASKLVGQFAYDLKFSGPVVLFSWPSQGSLTSYTSDATNAEWAQSHFVDLMTALLEKVTVENIYLVGHSMGNRIIGRGMARLASERPDDLRRFREVVMIAPDIDAEVFRIDSAPRLARAGMHTTLYASSNDRAMRASKVFNGYSRTGESGEALVVVDGVETIDASEVTGGFIGHSYFAEDRRIMEDIFGMLQSGQHADNRFNLEAVDTPQGRYWKLRK